MINGLRILYKEFIRINCYFLNLKLCFTLRNNSFKKIVFKTVMFKKLKHEAFKTAIFIQSHPIFSHMGILIFFRIKARIRTGNQLLSFILWMYFVYEYC